MQINEEMVQIALKKLVAAGLLPRHPQPVEAAHTKKVLQDMLEAVLAAHAYCSQSRDGLQDMAVRR